MQELIEVEAGDGRRISTLVVRPVHDRTYPVLIMFSHGPGLSPEFQLQGHRLSASGYAVVMIDRYSRRSKLLAYDHSEMLAEPDECKQFLELIQTVTDSDAANDLAAVMQQVRTEPWAQDPPWGAVGFGVGARQVIRAMADLPDVFSVGAGFHPSFCVVDEPDSPHLSIPALCGRLYLAIAGIDYLMNAEEIKTLTTAVECLDERGSYEIFPKAEHGFAIPGKHSDREATDRAFVTALRLFADTLAW